MIALLVRAFAAHAELLVEWETGYKPTVTVPKLASAYTEGRVPEQGETVEFRVSVSGIRETTYVVTVAEVHGR